MSLSKSLTKLALAEAKKLPGGDVAAELLPILYRSVAGGKKKAPKRRQQPSNTSMAPVAIARTATSTMPKSTFHRKITRDEALMTLKSTGTAFNNNTVHIQPGNAETFGWLSGQADAFQLYRFHDLEIYAVPMASTAEAGRYIIAPSYVESVEPSSANYVANAAGAQSNAIWASASVKLDVEAMFPFGKYKQINSGASNSQNSDACDLFVAFDGVASGVSIQLRAKYTVELFLPKIGVPASLVNSHAVVELSAYNLTTSFASPTAACSIDPFGIVKHPTLNAFKLPKGTWEIELNFQLDAASGAANWAMCDFRLAQALASETTLNTFTNQQASWAPWRVLQSINRSGGITIYESLFFKMIYLADGENYVSVVANCDTASFAAISAISSYMLAPIS